MTNSGLPTIAPPRQERKYFTLEDANRALPLVRRVVSDISDAYAEFLHSQIVLHESEGKTTDDEQFVVEKQVETAAMRLDKLIDELHAIGCDLKDPQSGLIDFWARHEERDVLLCWKSGEKQIGFWHEVEAGFEGRRAVSELAGTTRA